MVVEVVATEHESGEVTFVATGDNIITLAVNPRWSDVGHGDIEGVLASAIFDVDVFKSNFLWAESFGVNIKIVYHATI